MDANDPSPIVLHADSEHSGLRFAVLATFLVSFFLIFLMLTIILRSLSGTLISSFYFILSCAGALVLSIGAAGLAEYSAKRWWLSGRSIILNHDGIVATVDPPETLSFFWAGHNSLVRWYSHLSGYRRGGRERRVPAAWLCISCQLQQDESRIIVYSYMPEERAGLFIDDKRFLELRPGEYIQSSVFRRWLSPPSRPEIPTKVLVGKQGHYWLAERRRWNEGMELSIDDFFLFIEEVGRRVKE
jgi:hypothetical protein